MRRDAIEQNKNNKSRAMMRGVLIGPGLCSTGVGTTSLEFELPQEMEAVMPLAKRNNQYRTVRHPTTFASIGLVFSGAYHAPSRHSQRNGRRYVPLWSSHSNCSGRPGGGGPLLNSARRWSRVAILMRSNDRAALRGVLTVTSRSRLNLCRHPNRRKPAAIKLQ